jgi:toxin ParE1/3/4
LVSILKQTFRLFGPVQVRVYAGHIEHALAMIAEKPNRPGSQERSEIRPGVRSFHLQLATGRRKGAAHVLYYCMGKDFSSGDEVVILRILADEMEPKKRIALALRPQPGEPTSPEIDK